MLGNKLLSELLPIRRVMNAVAAGTTDQTTTGFNLQDYKANACLFICLFGALTSTQTTKVKVQVSDDDGDADAYSDLEGSLTAALDDGDGNKMVVIDVRHPPKPWLEVVIDRHTANAVIDGVIAIPYDVREVPVTQSTTYVAILKQLVGVQEGTA